MRWRTTAESNGAVTRSATRCCGAASPQPPRHADATPISAKPQARRVDGALGGMPPEASWPLALDVRLHSRQRRSRSLQVVLAQAFAQAGVVRHRRVAQLQEG